MALPAAVVAYLARKGAQKVVQSVGSQLRNRVASPSQKLTSWAQQKVTKGTGSKIKKPISSQYLSSQVRDRFSSPLQKLLRASPKGNIGSPAVRNAKAGLVGAGIVGGGAIGSIGVELWDSIKGLIESGKLEEDFTEAGLEQALMEADYDAEELNEVKGELYEGPDEDEKFLSSYIRGGQTGLRNEQGDFMTLQEAKDEYDRLYGDK